MKLIIRNDNRVFANDYHIINALPLAGIDLNYKESIKSDFTVIATGLIDPFGSIYIVDLFVRKIDISEFPRYFFSYYEKWQWENVGIDANANQIVVKPWLESLSGMPWQHIFPEDKRVKKIRVPSITPLESHGRSKYTLIESICSAEWRNIRFLKTLPFMSELKNQFENLRTSSHDDIPDAITNLLRIKRTPPILDVRRLDPSTGEIPKRRGKLWELLEGMDDFERLMVA